MPRVTYIFGCLTCDEAYSFEYIAWVDGMTEGGMKSMMRCWRDYHDTRDCAVPEERTAIIREIDGVEVRIAGASG